MSSCGWHIAVLIPARDEEQLLPRCLHSVRRARFRLPEGITCDTVVVSDSSRDRTTEIAQEILQDSGIVVCTDAGVVGSARALAAAVALQRCSRPPECCWLANTDADCKVPADWLTHQLAIAARGFAAVAGTVDVDSFVEHHPAVPDLFRRGYRINPDGTHPHVHGANFGVRADAYLRAGGWTDLATGEDHSLWSRMDGPGLRLSDASLRVMTSGRRVGRAPLGFAGALAAHNETAA